MSEFRDRVPESKVNAIARRAARLSKLVERATKSSPSKEVRARGGQLVEVLTEWVDQIQELHSGGDVDLEERVRSFTIRLHLAEQKVVTWHIPEKKKRPPKAKPARRPRVRASAKPTVKSAA